VRHPIEACAFGMMIEQLFGKPAAVVIAGAEEKNRLHRSPSVSCDLLDRSTIQILFFEPPYRWADGFLIFSRCADRPARYDEPSRFDTMTVSLSGTPFLQPPSLQPEAKILSA
jgi:hypothetical protein